MDEEKITTLTIRLPETLKIDAKTQAAKLQTNITKIVIEHLERFVKQGQTQPPTKTSH